MMAASMPRGHFRDRLSKRRKDKTMAAAASTSTISKATMHDLPSLVRTGPPPRLRHVRLSIGGTTKKAVASSSTSRYAKSLPEPLSMGDHETTRRKKLRGVIAMMEMSKRPVKRPNDVETHLQEITESIGKHWAAFPDKQRAKAEEVVKQRSKARRSKKTAVVMDDHDEELEDEVDTKKDAIAVMGKWQSFVRKKKAFSLGRRAGFAGHLPFKRKGSTDDDEMDRDNDKDDKMVSNRFGKFKTVAKLVIYLLRLSKTYILQESDARMVSLFSDIDAARASDHYKVRGDLLYDVTEYRAQKTQMISSETKRILLKEPENRTKKDIHHVMVELQQMKTITQYPVDMQRGLVANSWYEEFPTGRVIIRYGRNPFTFYVILGGSALHLEGDPSVPGRPVASLNKGDMFGEQAIAHQNQHVYTVISKERVQLMCLAPDDYCRIFLAGGMHNFSDLGENSFISSISIFKHWPVSLLKDNHKQTRFQYFVHGTTIVEDSNKSDWIIIVKSGSCSVLKKLVDPSSVPVVAKTTKKKKIVVPINRYKRDFHPPAESHQDLLNRKLKALQRKRAKAIKNSRWQRYIKKPTNLIKIPLHDDPFEEPNMSRDYRGDTDPVAAEMLRRHEESQKEKIIHTDNDEIIEEDDPADEAMDDDQDGDRQGEEVEEGGERGEGPMDAADGDPRGEHADAVGSIGGRMQSFTKGPFMTHKAYLYREPSKMDESNSTARKSNMSRRDSAAQMEGAGASRRGSQARRESVSHMDGLSRSNSHARRDSVLLRREGTHRRDSIAPSESRHGGRESVTQDSGMTDLTEATHTTGTGENQEEDDDDYEDCDDDDEPRAKTPPDPTHKFIMIDTLEKGGVFGVLDIAFGAQPSLSLVSNGAECILVKKKFYLKHANDKAIWNISEKLRPYPDEDTLTKDLKEKLTWKDHRDSTLKATALKFKKMRKRLADPRLQRPSTIVDTYT